MIPDIKYTWSSDGVNWSRPQIIGRGYSPTISVDDAGSIGVAFIGGPYSTHTGPLIFNTGTIYYRAKVPSPGNVNPWSGTFQIGPASDCSQPAIAGHRKSMHLVVAHSSGVRYYTFPTLAPTPPATIGVEEVFKFSPFLNYNLVTLPTIAVARRDDCDEKPPIIRVGVCIDADFQNGFNIHLAGVLLNERPLNVLSGLWNNVIYNDIQFGPTAPVLPDFAKGYSTSLASNKLKGDFYFGYSQRYGSTPVTKIVHSDRNGVSPNPFVAGGIANVLGTAIDVKAFDHRLISRFKYAIQPLSSTYLLNVVTLSWIDLQEGRWDGSQPPAWFAQFQSPVQMASSQTREPDLVFYMNNQNHGINGVFERLSGSGTSLETDYLIKYPTHSPLLPAPSPPDCEFRIGNREDNVEFELPKNFYEGNVKDPLQLWNEKGSGECELPVFDFLLRK